MRRWQVAAIVVVLLGTLGGASPAAADLAQEEQLGAALRARRAAGRAAGGVRAGRAVRPDRRRRPVRGAHRRAAGALGRRRPRPHRARRDRPGARPLRVPPGLPGPRALARLRLREVGAPHLGRPRADGVRARRHRPRPPRPARAPVLDVLRLQRLEQPARGRLGDDPAHLRRRHRRGGPDGAAARGRLQPARGGGALGLGRRQPRARRRHPPRRLPGRRLARELLPVGAAPRRVRPAGRRLR